MNIDSGTAFVLTYLVVNVGIAITCVLAAFAIGWLFHWLRERQITRGLRPQSEGPSQPYS